MEKQIENILSQVAEIVQQDRKQKELTGDNFNIFDILGLQANETKHSAFIAELLNPKGSHGFGDSFLQKFIKSIDYLKDLRLNTKKVDVQIEYPINSGRIDILIKSENKAIIIENKIDAIDQEAQLFRYSEFGESEFSDFRLVYLTRDGHKASDYSTKKKLREDEHYIRISYQTNILQWLEHCYRLSLEKPIVNNAINQYLNIVRKLTNQDMSRQNETKVLDILTEKDNVDATLAILNRKDAIREKIFEKYLVRPLQKFAKRNDLHLDTDELFKNRRYHSIYLYKENWHRSAIRIAADSPGCWEGFQIAIESRDDKPRFRNIYESIFQEQSDNERPFGWEFLDDKYQNWDDDILPAMIDGKVVKYLKDKIKKALYDLEGLESQGIKIP